MKEQSPVTESALSCKSTVNSSQNKHHETMKKTITRVVLHVDTINKEIEYGLKNVFIIRQIVITKFNINRVYCIRYKC